MGSDTMTEMTPLFPADANGVARGLIRHSPTDSVYRVEMEQEEDGRWLAEITDLPGVMAYGRSEQEALRRTLALARPRGGRACRERRARPDFGFASLLV
jgi:hypothetical protein